MLPSAEQLKAMKADMLRGPTALSPAEERLYRAHRILVESLQEGKMQAWGARHHQTVRGKPLPPGDLEAIPKGLWSGIKITYFSETLEDGRVLPSCTFHDKRVTTIRDQEETVLESIEYRDIVVASREFTAVLLETLPRLREDKRNWFRPARAVLVRPSSVEDTRSWRVRFDSAEFPLGELKGFEGIERGLKALWVLILFQGEPLPYLLLEAATYREADTQRRGPDAASRAATLHLRAGLKDVVEKLLDARLTASAAVKGVRDKVEGINRDMPAWGVELDLPAISALLDPGRTALDGRIRAPVRLTDAKESVRISLNKAAMRIRAAIEGKVGKLPELQARVGGSDATLNALGCLLNDLLPNDSVCWCHFEQRSPAPFWTPE
jgi:hypothetical protein